MHERYSSICQSAQQTGLAHVHAEADAVRVQLTEAVLKMDAAGARERAQIEEATTAKAAAARLTEQLKYQKTRSLGNIGKLEKSKQALEMKFPRCVTRPTS